MRNLAIGKLGGFGLALGLLAAAPAQAAGFMSCDQIATAAADQASKDQLQPAGDFEGTVPGKVLVFAAGQKFYMPAKPADDRSFASASVWQRMRDWNTAYSDAFWRCKHPDLADNSETIIIPLPPVHK
ncbi:MAG: hypothetical protein KGO53_07865 [Alphaproteobacteria bacterium]|nr:hypothetical protein [Alphaproteobacteria bacterium]